MKKLNLYKLYSSLGGYDTFKSCIVVAASEENAKLIHPYGDVYQDINTSWKWNSSCWERSPDQVIVELIGVAASHLKENEVIIASFNAG